MLEKVLCVQRLGQAWQGGKGGSVVPGERDGLQRVKVVRAHAGGRQDVLLLRQVRRGRHGGTAHRV